MAVTGAGHDACAITHDDRQLGEREVPCQRQAVQVFQAAEELMRPQIGIDGGKTVRAHGVADVVGYHHGVVFVVSDASGLDVPGLRNEKTWRRLRVFKSLLVDASRGKCAEIDRISELVKFDRTTIRSPTR